MKHIIQNKKNTHSSFPETHYVNHIIRDKNDIMFTTILGLKNFLHATVYAALPKQLIIIKNISKRIEI